jgi:carotenoid cleavage dioxygenase-like enzyme
MKNESARDQVQHWATLREYRVSLSASETTLSSSDTILRDAEGYNYYMDFPFVNPNIVSQRHQYVWGVTTYAKNSSHYADWAVLKVDRSASGVNTKVWYKNGHYPMEPIFVPKPNGAEDEGVVLVQVLDGEQDRGYLLILDGQTMAEVATASLDVGEHLPYTQHGRWYDEASGTEIIV